MAPLQSTSLYIIPTLLYYTLLNSTLPYHGSTWLYFTLHYSPWLYFIRLESTLLYSGSTSLYSTLHYSTMSTWLYITLPCVSTNIHSTWLYTTLPCLYFTLLYSTFLYNGSTSLYITLHDSTMALFHSTFLYHGCTSLYLTLHYSTIWFNFTLLDST